MSDAKKFGSRVASDIRVLGESCEQHPPHLISFDAWGKRLDKIWTCDSWKQLKMVSAQEALIAIAYKQPYGEYRCVFLYRMGDRWVH